MTATTPTRPAELLRGVDCPRPGQYRVRLTFRGLGTHCETFASAPEANARILHLRELRAAGLTPDQGARPILLRQAASEVLEILQLGELTEGGIEWWARILRPWMEGEFSAMPVHLLPTSRVIAAVRARAASHPTSGRHELAALKRTLRHARAEHRAEIPEALLELELPKRKHRRKRRALKVHELDHLAASAPAAYRRLILLQGSVGNRIGELLQARPEHLDWSTGTLLVPNPKEQRPKRIVLLDEELELFAEQLGVDRRGRALRPASGSATEHLPRTPQGSSVIWPMPDGRPWPIASGRVQLSYFTRLVWRPAIEAASASWSGSSDPFAGLTSHDLRATAITTMRDLGISEETCARRVGHADGGGLVRRIYDAGDRDARAAEELRSIAGRGILAAARQRAAGERTEIEAGGAAR